MTIWFFFQKNVKSLSSRSQKSKSEVFNANPRFLKKSQRFKNKPKIAWLVLRLLSTWFTLWFRKLIQMIDRRFLQCATFTVFWNFTTYAFYVINRFFFEQMFSYVPLIILSYNLLNLVRSVIFNIIFKKDVGGTKIA